MVVLFKLIQDLRLCGFVLFFSEQAFFVQVGDLLQLSDDIIRFGLRFLRHRGLGVNAVLVQSNQRSMLLIASPVMNSDRLAIKHFQSCILP